jgi:hypothetical protein
LKGFRMTLSCTRKKTLNLNILAQCNVDDISKRNLSVLTRNIVKYFDKPSEGIVTQLAQSAKNTHQMQQMFQSKKQC